MDLRNLKVDEIKNLEEYKTIFADYNFFDQNNLHIVDGTFAVYKEAKVCNRVQLDNYLKLITILFRSFEYFEFEIRMQVGIIDTMLSEVSAYYETFKAEVDSYTGKTGINWAEDEDNEADYRRSSVNLDIASHYKTSLTELMKELVSKLDNPLKR